MAAMDEAFASPASDSRIDTDLRGKATTANSLAIISIVLTVLWYCSGMMSLLFAFPMGMIAIHYARTVLAEQPDEVSEVYARNAMTMGVISTLFSGLFLLVIGGIVLMYMGIIVLAIAGNL